MADIENQEIMETPPIGGKPYTPPRVTVIPDEAQPKFSVIDAPPIGGKPYQRPKGYMDKALGAAMGTLVEDPLSAYRMGTIIAGGFAGGTFGAKAGAAFGPFGIAGGGAAGGALGAVSGVVAPEATLEIMETVGAIPEGTREEVGLSNEDLRRVAEGEALLELAFLGTFSGFRLLGRGAAKTFTGITKEHRDLAERAAKEGIELMPVQLGNRLIARGHTAVLGRFPFFGTSIRRRGQAAEAATMEAIENLPGRVGPIGTWAEVSEIIFRDASDLVTKTNDMFSARYTELWKRADELGVVVVPRRTVEVADEVLGKIGRETQTLVEGEARAAKFIRPVQTFIKREVLPMMLQVEGGAITAKQSLAQMDGLISKIDQEIAGLDPAAKKFAIGLFQDLRQAIQFDSVSNLRGTGAQTVANDLRQLDMEFSQTVSQLFETATAKAFGSVKRKGLRSIAHDDATRIPVDQLSRLIVKMESPQAVEELHRLVTPETFNRIIAQTLDDAIEVAGARRAAFDPTVTRGGFDIERFAKAIGFDKAGGNRREAFSRMLDLTDHPIRAEQIDTIIETGRAIQGLDLPNVSSFIARRATIGGIQSIINGAVPGMVLTAGSGGAGGMLGGFGLGTLVAGATLLGGAKLMSAIISKPESARALRKVMDREASLVVRRTAWAEAITKGLEVMKDDMSEGEYAKLQSAYTTLENSISDFVKELE